MCSMQHLVAPKEPLSSFMDRLALIGMSVSKFCMTTGIAPVSAKRWRAEGVSQRYVLMLGYLETLYAVKK